MPSHYKDVRVPYEVAQQKRTFFHHHNHHVHQQQESFGHVPMSDIFHTKLSSADDASVSISKETGSHKSGLNQFEKKLKSI